MTVIKPFQFDKFLVENERFIESHSETAQEFLVYPKKGFISLDETHKMYGPDPVSILSLESGLRLIMGTWDAGRQCFVVSKRKILILNTLSACGETRKIGKILMENPELRHRLLDKLDLSQVETNGNGTEASLSHIENCIESPESQVKTSISKLKDYFGMSQAEIKRHVQVLLDSGMSAVEIASTVGISRASAYRLLPKASQSQTRSMS